MLVWGPYAARNGQVPSDTTPALFERAGRLQRCRCQVWSKTKARVVVLLAAPGPAAFGTVARGLLYKSGGEPPEAKGMSLT